MRKWALPSLGLVLCLAASVIRSLSSPHERLTFKFVDSITGQTVPNVSVSITEQRVSCFPRVWRILTYIGVVKAPAAKTCICPDGVLTAYSIVKHPRYRTCFSWSAPFHQPGISYHANGTNYIDEYAVGCPVMITPVQLTNGVLCVSLHRFILEGLH